MNFLSSLSRYFFYAVSLTAALASFSASANTNLALNKTVTVSSVERSGMEAVHATDGNTNSRWSSSFNHSNWLVVDLGASYNINRVTLNWEAAYGKGYQIQTSANGTDWTTIYTTTAGDGGIDDLTISGTGRYVRMNGTAARANGWGYSLWEVEVYGTAVATAPVNIAFKKPVTVSSVEKTGMQGANANDGNVNSRWSSSYNHNNWLVVDLKATYNISRVKLNWEDAYGKGYQIQTSANGTDWTTIYSTSNGDGGIDDLNISGTGRYVRMNGTAARANGWGYSLWEIEIYAAQTTAPVVATNVAIKKPVTASSVEMTSTAAGNVNDGNNNSRWASSYAHANWISIDLGTTYNISRVKLNWEEAYGKGYQIQTSANGTTWTTIYTTTNGDGGIDDLTVSGVGRYVRMNGTATRANGWGYSLWEMEVYGVPAAGNSSSSSSSSSVKSSSSSSVVSSSSSSSSVKSSSSVSSSSSSSAGSGTGSLVVLDWYTPTARENGAYLELDEISGYEIKYKKTTDTTFTAVRVNDGGAESHTLGYLSGTYEFYIATIDSDGIYSEFVRIQPY